MELLFLTLLLFLSLTSSSSSSSSSSSDIQTLLAFKNSSDPLNRLHSWSPTTSPCSSTSSWVGVSCSSSGRVTRLVLNSLSLSSGPTAALPILTNLAELRVLSLNNNSLSGPLPTRLPSSLRLLFLSRNLLSGPLPPSLPPRLFRLDLSFNRLSGPLTAPFSNDNNNDNASTLHSSSRLLTLRLDSNNFTGSISALAAFPSLVDFNVSCNALSGPIPPSLSRFPAGSFSQNPRLCGPPLRGCCRENNNTTAAMEKPEVAPPRQEKRGLSRAAVGAIVAGDFVVITLVAGLLLCCCWRRFGGAAAAAAAAGNAMIQESEKIVYSSSANVMNNNVVGGGGGFERPGRMMFCEGTKRFEVEDLLKASAEMLGKGVYGTAYKAVLGDGNVVAVKRLREAAGGESRREFEGLMGAVGGMRHGNVVALKAYYYAADERLLVFEFMPAGSLFSLLHGNRGPGRTPLDWTTRMRIAAGAARGLAYIHHHTSSNSKPKLCHGNIKSTNILLDKSLTPKLADFCLHPLFPSPPRPHHGYAAPECLVDSRRPFSQKADIYAFGVVLLEILTGKVVTEEVNLPEWVQSVVREEWTSEVFDLELMRYKGAEEEMVGMLQVAMACVAVAPQQRPKIGLVVRMIEEIRGEGSPAYESFGEMESPCLSDDTGTIRSL